MRGHDEEGLNVMLLEEGMPLVAKARLYLIVAVETFQGGSRDVDLPEKRTVKDKTKSLVKSAWKSLVSKDCFLSLYSTSRPDKNQSRKPLNLIEDSRV